MPGVIHGYNYIYTRLNEVFRNQLVSETIIIDANELENVIYEFKTKRDSIDEARPIIELAFRKADFI